MPSKNGKISRKEIKRDLLDQLERNGTIGSHYLDLINDYMDMYDTKKELINDIKDRGVSVEWNNGGGQTGYKKNDSVDQLVKINGQMLKLLDALGIKPSIEDGDNDFDLEM